MIINPSSSPGARRLAGALVKLGLVLATGAVVGGYLGLSSLNKIEFHPLILKAYSPLLLAPLLLPHEWTHKLTQHISLPDALEEGLSYIMGVFVPVVILALLIGPYVMEAPEERELAYLREVNARLIEEIARRERRERELNKKIKELEDLSIKDERTGLFNYRGFQYWLNSEIGRIDRYGGSLYLVMLDIDNFKEINDTYGHPCGDKVLEKLVEIIKTNIRKTDILCRYGGEEFALIMPGAELEEAVIKKIEEEIIERVASTPIEIGKGKSIKVTLSAGIASYSGQAETQEELIKKADIALYRSKENGKNQLTAYQSADRDTAQNKKRNPNLLLTENILLGTAIASGISLTLAGLSSVVNLEVILGVVLGVLLAIALHELGHYIGRVIVAWIQQKEKPKFELKIDLHRISVTSSKDITPLEALLVPSLTIAIPTILLILLSLFSPSITLGIILPLITINLLSLIPNSILHPILNKFISENWLSHQMSDGD